MDVSVLKFKDETLTGMPNATSGYRIIGYNLSRVNVLKVLSEKYGECKPDASGLDVGNGYYVCEIVFTNRLVNKSKLIVVVDSEDKYKHLVESLGLRVSSIVEK